MSMVINEGVKIHFKAAKTWVFKAVGLIIEISTAIEKTKVFLEASVFIRWHYITVTYNSLYSCIFRSFDFSSTLQSHL